MDPKLNVSVNLHVPLNKSSINLIMTKSKTKGRIK